MEYKKKRRGEKDGGIRTRDDAYRQRDSEVKRGAVTEDNEREECQKCRERGVHGANIGGA